MAQHTISWFEIMSVDFDRAVKFYESILAVSLQRQEMMGGQMGMFPGEKESVSGAVWHDAKSRPSVDGTCVYLNADGKLDVVLGRVAAAGGAVLQPRTSIGQHGFIALIKDTEGNRVGLYSMT